MSFLWRNHSDDRSLEGLVFLLRIIMKNAILTISLILIMGFGHFNAAFAQPPQDPIPNLAYYYIWYTEASWARAKSDYPQLGRYNSDDRAVMEQHVKWAKEASIKGFIVSWKSTPTLNRRLETLMDVAAKADFSLPLVPFPFLSLVDGAIFIFCSMCVSSFSQL